ncbi:AbiH family protein [Bacteroides nordii]|uniref:AbiH family protein n=1 Tax=Bacteroides nordii TaxID=291645 RepID=UPI0020414CE5|nr:AbiH family protein [Bacteroides nordii]GFZ38946.1 hypothetical protein BANORC5_09810 [Bacteroides nordii]
MNRIIIIGNGFDLAHNLKTGYKDFIDHYWTVVKEKIYGEYWQWLDEHYGKSKCPHFEDYEDKFVHIERKYDRSEIGKVCCSCKEDSVFGKLCTLIDGYNNVPNAAFTVHIKFKNHFFERISYQCSLVNWVDIENEYYDTLKELLQEENVQKQDENIRILNKEFDDVKVLLENYLTKVTKVEVNLHQSIQDVFSNFVEYNEIATYKRTAFVDSIFSIMTMRSDFCYEEDQDLAYQTFDINEEKRMYFIEKNIDKMSFKKNYLVPDDTLLLNFNYTNTAEKLYAGDNIHKIINIHGELNNENNPIIFGYGDELDDDYKKIERLQNNEFLENIKSIRYHKTRNYRSLLEFIALGPYQVFIMGHSCGNSDRTLLNTLFEHVNCLSIKIFYRQYEDGTDNYIDLIKNISRNFNSKPNMRDIVVNREYCSPLIPIDKKAAQ